MKMLIKIIVILVVLVLIYIFGNIVYAKMTYFNPATLESLRINDHATAIDTSKDKEYSAMIWNIGYAGLGKEADFFYDGGKMMQPSEPLVNKYFEGIMNTIEQNPSDFILLQEVDSFSKRSYYIEEMNLIKNTFSANYKSTFALNYKVNYIPQPWLTPMGKVNSGLMTLSKFEANKTVRHQLPGEFGFPKQLFFLRRCLLVNYYPLSNGKFLVMVNIHNSAYDDEGTLKKQEMAYLKTFLNEEYSKGNYIICGGDWNQCPPNFKYNQLAKGKEGDYFQTNVSQNFIPNWQWIFDPKTPTNRKNNKPFEKNKTFVTLIDFYLVSPNIEITSCQGISNDFEFSDHQPVHIKFKLK